MIVFVCLLVIFSVLNFLISNAFISPRAGQDAQVLLTTLGTISGPLVGAISRDFQDCCLGFSLAVMAFCGPILLLGALVQYLTMPAKKWLRVIRMTLWGVGWFVWFAGGIVSFSHALS
jgi:hypothetical protein